MKNGEYSTLTYGDSRNYTWNELFARISPSLIEIAGEERIKKRLSDGIYDDVYDEEKIKALWNPRDWKTTEGYVLRLASSFHYKDFKNSVGKFVRKSHVQTVKHWMFGQAMEKNELGEK